MIISRPPTTSIVSRIVHILIKVRFLPLELNNPEQKISFRFCSSLACTFYLVYWGLFLFVSLVGQLASQKIRDDIEEYLESTNIIDAISVRGI